MNLLPRTPPTIFAVVCLLLITLTAMAIGYVQSNFFRDAVIQREAVIVRDLATAIAARNLRAEDLEHHGETAALINLQQRFGILSDLTGVMRIKVFNADHVVVWSDAASLIGLRLAKDKYLSRAIAGGVAAVFNPDKRATHADESLPDMPLIEFYVPFSVVKLGSAGEKVYGALSLYRSAEDLTATLERGLWLLWLVNGAGGAILFAAIFWLFNAVYRRQREAEHRFHKLSSEHARIVQMEKLSAMGQMVGEIAHQFNNPLVGVINLTQRAECQLDDPAHVRELLGEIRKAGEHCSVYVQRMLRFTQMARLEPLAVVLDALVCETVAFFRQTVGAAPEVVYATTANAAETMVEADPVLLRHALFNLIQNAAQADPRGPVRVALDAAMCEGIAGWQLSVADRGPGIAPEVVARLFTPFFSTRPGGTGLGLSVAHHITVRHGGELWAEDNPGGGVRFVLWLPTGEIRI